MKAGRGRLWVTVVRKSSSIIGREYFTNEPTLIVWGDFRLPEKFG